MKCLECNYLNLQKDKVMSQHGFGHCKWTIATYYSLEKDHDCNKFVKAEDSKIEKRRDWYDKR